MPNAKTASDQPATKLKPAKLNGGITERTYFTPQRTWIDVPNLVEHQVKSWQDFVKYGLNEIFEEINPIEDYTGQKLALTFNKYHFDEPKITEAQARADNVSFEASLHVEAELVNKITGEVKTGDIYLGDYPWMTERGTFVINGSERVVVSQLIRSPGVFFSAERVGDQNYYGAKLIPGRGAWLEFETATSGVLYVKIDRRRKLTVTTLLRALGVGTNAAIKDLFKDVDTGDLNYIDASFAKDTSKTTNEALIEVYRKLRPGDLATVDNARSMIEKMFFDFKRYDVSRVGRYKLNQRLGFDTPNNQANRVLKMEDLTAIIAEIIRLNNTQEPADDIDALYNRRVKMVGELVGRQFRVGMLRLSRNVTDRMSVADLATVTPNGLINARPVVAAVREFFASSQLSQFMDQANPLSELSHKRRLSSMGPGGLSRERAGIEVRDVHPTHYGRICTVETPEGANIGLVLNLAAFARVNEYGFLEAPYVKVKNGVVDPTVVYLGATQEMKEVIAAANTELDAKNRIVAERVSARRNLRPEKVDRGEVTMMDASRMEIIGSTAALVPFLERNRNDRALTGSNMQRQAVPLIKTTAPIVGTGMEKVVAKNTSQLITAKAAGEITKADADEVIVKYGTRDFVSYPLTHFVKSNEDRSFNQRTVVKRGQKVVKGQPLIEGASVADGELALGRDILVAFMPWQGYNMDDSIIISRRLVQDDELTNINI
ncbi:MAG: DNA-directed RNA polymerase subunit beta, partial [Candidatus Nomurabacteria bacterium]|nr:DNA-directed RNA polymerase subunit beta [Candidatus Nomurabacteria bacterium]